MRYFYLHLYFIIHRRVPPQVPTPEYHLRVPSEGPTLGSHFSSVSIINKRFNVAISHISILVLFVTAWVLFEGVFFLSVASIYLNTFTCPILLQYFRSMFIISGSKIWLWRQRKECILVDRWLHACIKQFNSMITNDNICFRMNSQ